MISALTITNMPSSSLQAMVTAIIRCQRLTIISLGSSSLISPGLVQLAASLECSRQVRAMALVLHFQTDPSYWVIAAQHMTPCLSCLCDLCGWQYAAASLRCTSTLIGLMATWSRTTLTVSTKHLNGAPVYGEARVLTTIRL